MLNLYPLRPIVSNNPQLPALYDNHPASVELISACITPAELSELLDRGAVFDTVLFMNDEHVELQERLCPAGGDEAFFPRVEFLAIERIDGRSVPLIHSAFGSRRARGFFAAGG